MAKLILDKNELMTIVELCEVQPIKTPHLKQEVEQLKKRVLRALNPIKISSRKGKARNLQMFICKEIADMLGINFNQQDDQCLIHSREMGQSGADIIVRGEAKKLFPFAIECKSSETLQLTEAIDQAKSNAKDDPWMVIHKRKVLKSPIVIIGWETFREFYTKRGYLL